MRSLIADQGPIANRPAAGVEGRFWWNESEGVAYIDTGAKWERIPAFDINGVVVQQFAAPAAGPYGLAFDGTDLWISVTSNQTIYRVGTSDGAVLQSFAAPGGNTHGLAWDGANLWNFDDGTDFLYKLNPADGTVVTSFAGPNWTRGLTFDGTYLRSVTEGSIHRLSPTGGTIVSSISSPGDHGLTWDGADLWVSDWGTRTIYRFDSGYGTVKQEFATPSTGPYGLAWGGNHLWHCDYGTNLIYKIE